MPTKSIGATGRDYSTLALYAAFINAQDLASTGSQIGECYNDSEFDVGTTTVSLGGWTNADASHTVTLTCHAGQSFRDNANVLTNALRYNQANGVAIRGSVPYAWIFTVTGSFLTITGLQCRSIGSNNGGMYLQNGNITTNALQNCIAQGAVVGTLASITMNGGQCLNNLVLITSGDGDGMKLSYAATATDNTIFTSNGSAGTGMKSAGTGAIAKNNAVAGFTTDYSGTADASSTNNATDKGSFGGTNWGGSGQVSLVAATEWTVVTAGSEDMRVKSTSVKLKGNGATVGPTDDIAKQTRTAPYTIGAWQFVSAASNPLIFLMNIA